MTPTDVPIRPFQIEVIIEGQLDARRASWFEGLALTSRADGTTLITGTLADQTALFALVSRLRDLGLKLISIHRTEIDKGISQ